MIGERDGVVEAIDARAIGNAVRRLGAGRLHPAQQVDHAVGVELMAKVGEPVAIRCADRDDPCARRMARRGLRR